MGMPGRRVGLGAGAESIDDFRFGRAGEGVRLLALHAPAGGGAMSVQTLSLSLSRCLSWSPWLGLLSLSLSLPLSSPARSLAAFSPRLHQRRVLLSPHAHNPPTPSPSLSLSLSQVRKWHLSASSSRSRSLCSSVPFVCFSRISARNSSSVRAR